MDEHECEFDDEDIAKLPEDFQVFGPLIKAWCIGDDEIRSERMAQTSTNELRQACDTVYPHFDAINTYLDGFGGDVPWEACALVNLGEAIMEMKFLLDERNGMTSE